MAFAIKAEVRDPRAKTFALSAQKTMYGGKHIARGDTVFVFASENEGGQGLIARGVVMSAEAIAKKPGIIRQTPRVSVTIQRTALAKRRLGRSELKHFTDWNDGQPGTEHTNGDDGLRFAGLNRRLRWRRTGASGERAGPRSRRCAFPRYRGPRCAPARRKWPMRRGPAHLACLIRERARTRRARQTDRRSQTG